MSAATVTAGKCSWVNANYPNARHFDAPKLKVDDTEALTFVHLKNPVPDGDVVSVATLRLVVATGATGSFTFTARKCDSRVDWSDLTWNNRPGVVGSSVTASVTDPAAGDVVEFTVSAHVQSVANGDPNYGWRIESNSTTAVKFWGFDSDDGPQLEVEWSSVPATPTDMVPVGVVSLAKPFIQFSAPDSTGDDELNAVQVQIAATALPAADADGTWTSPTFDSGTVTDTVPELDLSTTAYGGITGGATVYYHVRWRNSLNVWSEWGDTVAMTRTAKSSLTIDNPPVGGTVLEATPPFLATFAGTAKSWRVRVVEVDDPSEIVAESGKQKATDPNDIAWTPDKSDRLQDDVDYRVIVDVWDNVDRVRSVGDPEYTRATRDFTVDYDIGTTAPTAVSVTTHPNLPVPVVNFTRASAPDFFAIKRDGETVETKIEPGDVFVSGTSYSWIDRTTIRQPMVDHTYKVRAIVNGEQSDWSSPVTGHVSPKGLWLISLDRDEKVRLAGDDINDWRAQDEVGVFKVHGRSEPVLIRSSLGALGGSFSGVLMDDDLGRSIDNQQADLARLRRRDEPCLLVAADYAAKVRIYDVTDAPHPQTVENRIWRRVSFSFVESDR